MIATSQEYKRQLIAGNRNFVTKIIITFKDNNTLTVTNEDIWEGGVTLDNAISSDSSFDIGTAIVGNLKVVLNNIYNKFSQYDFYDAKLVLYLGVTNDLNNGEQRYYRIGNYVVDSPSYNGSLITLNCLDNMIWFDVPFDDVSINFPTTAGALVSALCSHVGVTLATPSFPSYNLTLSTKPEEKLNCREVLQYVAQYCCCYCKINTAGQLVLTWYDKSAIIGLTDYSGGTYYTDTTPYSDGDNLNGGTFSTNTTPYSDGDSVDGGTFTQLNNSAFLGNNFEIEVSTDDIVVTGCRVVNDKSEEDGYDYLYADSVIEQTHSRYILVIENNPFINKTNANATAIRIGTILAGLPIRGFRATSLADFSYETGDVVTVIDFRGNVYHTWITSFTFTTHDSESFSCGVQSVKERSERRYSNTIKTLAQANENASQLLSDYDNAVQAMNDLAQDALGYNQYTQTAFGGGVITWLYNGNNIDTSSPLNPRFSDSTVVFKISGDGVFISNDGGATYTQGYDANSGTAILNLIFAHGITADWINTGTLKVGGSSGSSGNVDGSIVVYDGSNNLLGQWNKNGVLINQGTITTKETYAESGTTYQKGVEISGGEINFLPPATATNAEGHLRFFSGVQSNSKASVDFYANGGIRIEGKEAININTQNNKAIQLSTGSNNELSLDRDGIYMYTADTLELNITNLIINTATGYSGTVTVDGRNLQFTYGILTGVS